jgi:hypothetical protein
VCSCVFVCVRVYVRVCVLVCAFKHACGCAYACVNACVRACACVKVCVRVDACVCVPVRTCTCVRACVRVCLRWSWVFLEPTRILSGIQFTMHFIEFCVVETKRFVGCFVNVILPRQTCGQRSSKAAESKH